MARSLRALWRHPSLFQWGQCHIYPLAHPASFSDLIQDVTVRCSGASGTMGRHQRLQAVRWLLCHTEGSPAIALEVAPS